MASARIVPTFYASQSNKYNQFALDGNYNDEHTSNAGRLSYGILQIPQVKNKFQQPNLDLNSQQGLYLHGNSELANIGKQSFGSTFQNDGSGYDGDELDLKSSTPLKETEMIDTFGLKTSQLEVDPSSPHLIKVPVPHPYPVHIPVKQPFTVPIFKLVPQEVEKKIPIPVEKLVPVYKEKPVKIIVEKHHPVHVFKPYTIPVDVNTHILLGKKKTEQW
ncbi:hypothetical protein BDFB_010682 [Asbolus verrucosus]|uniref:Uncharacterized protein n=1 Tax=Asbolus verrucosus TaxID=1661398 RepID=A0A482VHK1_ASBVE|nr:hypothetical protein BDFB_010682 [Asbolus verrucosus]